MKKFEEYAKRQRLFWNTKSEDVARFERVHLDAQRSEENWNALAAATVEYLTTGIPLNSSTAVLELGCGVGRLLERIAAGPYASLTGVDISKSMIEFAERRLRTVPRLKLLVNNGYDLADIPDASIDFAYSVDVFIHIFDFDLAQNYIREVSRILKKGGAFRFNVRLFRPTFGNTPGGLFATLMYRLGIYSLEQRWNSEKPAEFNGIAYTPALLNKMLRQAGLSHAKLSAHGILSESRTLWVVVRK